MALLSHYYFTYAVKNGIMIIENKGESDGPIQGLKQRKVNRYRDQKRSYHSRTQRESWSAFTAFGHGESPDIHKKSESIDPEETNLFNYNEAENLSTTTLETEIKDIKAKPARKPKSKNHEQIDLEKFVTKTITHSPVEDDDIANYDRVSQDVIYKADVKVSIEVTKHIYETVKHKETNQLVSVQRDFL